MMYKTAIVTGASSGIGASIASRLASNGTKVYAIARSKKALKSIQDALPMRAQKRFISVVGDVSDRDKLKTVLGGIYKKSPAIDLVVSNAGVGYSKGLTDHTWDEIDTVIATNLKGTINIVRLCLGLQKKHPIHFVATTSLAGKIGFPNMSIYSASKFALEGLFESLSYEYPSNKVSFTILRPGITGTSFFSKAGMQDFEKSVKYLKSFYTPDKVAEVFLSKIRWGKRVIVVGNDKYFLAILPFLPFRHRFKVLDFINKL